jgi:LCP family protein required for cell wall assembly
MADKKTNIDSRVSALNKPSIFQIALFCVGLLLAVALWIGLSGFVSCWSLTSLPGIPLPSCSNNSSPVQIATDAAGTPVAAATPTATLSAPDIPLPPPWDGASRVNVLVIGLRGGSNQDCPLCTDTMILLTIDPVTKTAGMLSIPRDMWVNIPGFGYGKINSAYTLGDLYKLPGGGMGLTIKTVENFIGIPIQYYAQVDFDAFSRMIDDIGGICLNVPVKVNVGVLDENGTTTIDTGYQCMDGKVALGYARTRDISQGVTGGDVERSQNQQRVILAVRDKVLSNLPALVSQAVPLYTEISSGVHTNLSLDDILRLAILAKDIPLSSINQGVIDYTMMQDGKTVVNGMEVAILRPFPDKIRELVDKIFGGGTLAPLATGDPTQLMQDEGASVFIINASDINGAAQKMSDYLKSQGVNVVGVGNRSDYPDKYSYPPLPDRTELILHTGKPYTMNFLMSLLKFDSANQLVIDYKPDAPADIVLAVGTDWANAIP